MRGFSSMRGALRTGRVRKEQAERVRKEMD